MKTRNLRPFELTVIDRSLRLRRASLEVRLFNSLSDAEKNYVEKELEITKGLLND